MTVFFALILKLVSCAVCITTFTSISNQDFYKKTSAARRERKAALYSCIHTTAVIEDSAHALPTKINIMLTDFIFPRC